MITCATYAHGRRVADVAIDDINRVLHDTPGFIWIAVPTMIAGIYGMNFQFMPELQWGFGYPVILIGMACACAVLYVGFRRSGWL